MKLKKHIWAFCFSAALIAFTTYIALDTFVIPRVYKANATEMNTSMFSNIPKTYSYNGCQNFLIKLHHFEKYTFLIFYQTVHISSFFILLIWGKN